MRPPRCSRTCARPAGCRSAERTTSPSIPSATSSGGAANGCRSIQRPAASGARRGGRRAAGPHLLFGRRRLRARRGDEALAGPSASAPDLPYPYASAAELLEMAARAGLAIAGIALANEDARRPARRDARRDRPAVRGDGGLASTAASSCAASSRAACACSGARRRCTRRCSHARPAAPTRPIRSRRLTGSTYGRWR